MPDPRPSHPLDRPVWSALSTRQAPLSEGCALARRFTQDISPLAGARDGSADAVAALAALIPAGDDISLLEAAPPPAPPGLDETLRARCLQMTAAGFPAEARSFPIEPLVEADAAEMLALALLTRPGPFRARTHALGRFIGIREGGRLVAMAGERLAVDGFIEASAVCTHPDYRGRGYGAALLAAVGACILRDGATPFLHSYADNAPAIALYRRLGFTVRAEVLHAVWKRA